MNDNRKRSLSLKTLGQGIIELLFYLPLFLIPAVYLLPAADVWIWIATLPLCYWAASLMTGRYPKLRYGIRLLQAAVIGSLHGVLIIGVGQVSILPIILCSIAAAIIAMRGMSAQIRGWAASFPNTQLLIGAIIYAVMQPMKLILFKRLIDYNSVLVICGITAVILFFFFANERHLNSETTETVKTSAVLAIKRQNRLMIAIIVGMVSILALFRQIQQAIEGFFHSILKWVMSWLDQPEKQAPVEEQPIIDPAPQLFPPDEAKPPPDWMLILEQILKIAAIVLVIIIAILILFFLLKKLYQWVKLFAAKLLDRGTESRNSAVGFTDEVEHLMTLTNWREQMGNKLKKLLPKKRAFSKEWNELSTNREKIRYLYSRFLWADAERGYMVKTYLTPRETADDMAKWKEDKHKQGGIHRFIDVYEEVRYGDKLPDDGQVAAFKQQLDNESK